FKALADVGFRSLWIGFDASASWTEATRTIMIPARVEFDGLFSATATVSINNVQRNNFETDPAKFGEAARDLEAGTIEFSLRDIGGLDLVIAHFAKTQNLS